ncbi:MAG: hypothetical protein AAF567_02995 [Actinomycetota bacterium]
MAADNLTQLVGALGAWMEARPADATPETLTRASNIVLSMRLLGVELDDTTAPVLDELEPEDRAVVDRARSWAQARREEQRIWAKRDATRRREQAARQARVERAQAARARRDALSAEEPAESQEPQDLGGPDATDDTDHTPILEVAFEPIEALPTGFGDVTVETGPVEPRVAAVEPGDGPARSAEPMPEPTLSAAAVAELGDLVVAELAQPESTIDSEFAATLTAGQPTLMARLRSVEEYFWWAICLAAIGLLVWRQLG